MNWEYQSFGFWWAKWPDALDYLNERGASGWEVVSFSAQESHRTNSQTDLREAKLWGLFKRPVAMRLTGDID